MASYPLVSIICPLYNKKAYIKETIDSVINQGYKNWEMVIVDDGSTDGSYEFVAGLIESESRIQLYRRTAFKENKGGSVCRNIGISLAKGEYIMFLDADDLLINGCLENRTKASLQFPHHDLYIFSVLYFKDTTTNIINGHGWNRLDKIQYRWSKNKKLYFLKRFLQYYLPWTISNVLWRKDLLVNIGGFDESFQRLQDPEIHTKALLQRDVTIKNMLFSHQPDVLIRVDEQRHGQSLGSKIEKYQRYVSASHQFISKFKEELENNDNFDFIRYLRVHLLIVATNINYAAAFSSDNDEIAAFSRLQCEHEQFGRNETLLMSHLPQS